MSTSPPPKGQGADLRLALVVYHRGGLDVVPLVEGQPVVLGRTPVSDVCLDSRRLSRRHASFLFDGEQVFVEDLASTNGTSLNGIRVDRAPFRAGDEVTLGSATVVLHRMHDVPVGLLGQERFRAEVEHEIARARTFDRSLAVLVLKAQGPGPRLGPWVPPLMSLLRVVDRAALYDADEIALLLPEANADVARSVASGLVQGLALHRVVGVGIAVWPDHASETDPLLEAARDAVVRATQGRPVVLPRRDAAVQPSEDDGAGPVVRDPAMVSLYRTLGRVASSSISVLIVGETGSGKEVVARSIHEQSPRADAPMRVINCGAIPATLLESTLFGHERGSFTGADQRRTGIFEEADGGTVLLDEIGELSLAAQVALLRVLETRKIQRVGSSLEIPVDARVLAATHRDLEAMCAAGTFRQDLLYRLNAITLAVPPLRERRTEIRTLVARFIGEANALHGRRVRGLSAAALACLEAYPWPGNVRELRNVVDRAVVVASGEVVVPDDLPQRMRLTPPPSAPSSPASRPGMEIACPLDALDLKARVRAQETRWIRAALHHCRENRTHAAQLLRMPRRTLVYKLKAHDIQGGDPAASLPGELDGAGPSTFAEHIRRYERALVIEALERADTLSDVARLLNIQKRTLEEKLKRHGLEPGGL